MDPTNTKIEPRLWFSFSFWLVFLGQGNFTWTIYLVSLYFLLMLTSDDSPLLVAIVFQAFILLCTSRIYSYILLVSMSLE